MVDDRLDRRVEDAPSRVLGGEPLGAMFASPGEQNEQADDQRQRRQGDRGSPPRAKTLRAAVRGQLSRRHHRRRDQCRDKRRADRSARAGEEEGGGAIEHGKQMEEQHGVGSLHLPRRARRARRTTRRSANSSARLSSSATPKKVPAVLRVDERPGEVAEVEPLWLQQELVGPQQFLDDRERRIGGAEMASPRHNRSASSSFWQHASPTANARNGAASSGAAASVRPGATEIEPRDDASAIASPSACHAGSANGNAERRGLPKREGEQRGEQQQRRRLKVGEARRGDGP